MKKKLCIILSVLIVIFVIGNLAYDSKASTSDDGLWKLVFVKYPLLDEWEGFLFYKGDINGDVGRIETCMENYNGYTEDEYIYNYPEKYYGRQFSDPLSLSPFFAMGIKPVNTYSILVSWEVPEKVNLDIIWNDNEGVKRHSKIVLEDKYKSDKRRSLYCHRR